jgi:hypothetical protein
LIGLEKEEELRLQCILVVLIEGEDLKKEFTLNFMSNENRSPRTPVASFDSIEEMTTVNLLT